MKVLVTGGREWDNQELIKAVLSNLPKDCVIIHGGQKTQMTQKVYHGPTKVWYIGADYQAGEIAKELGFEVVVYKAEWDKVEAQGLPRGAAGPIRNQRMIDEGKPDQVIAFHAAWQNSKGTKDTINRAIKAKIPVFVWNMTGGLYAL